MTKQTGMGDNFYIGGYDLSGDVSAVQTIARRSGLLDMTPINKSAHERIYGLDSGEISFSTFFNTATSQQHDALKGLPTTDRIVMWLRGTALGGQGASMVAKQVNYDWNRTADMGLLATIQCISNLNGNSDDAALQFTRSLTAGKRTDSDATDGSSVDDGTQATAVSITSSSVDNPTVITTAADHELVTGDSVLIAGHGGSTPDINGDHTVTRLTDTTYEIPVNVTVGGTGGTSTKTSTSFGLSAYLQVFAFTGASVTIKLQESSDDGVSDAFADITGGGFATVSSAPAEEFIETSRTLTVERYLRLVTTGTFSEAIFAVTYFRYKA